MYIYTKSRYKSVSRHDELVKKNYDDFFHRITIVKKKEKHCGSSKLYLLTTRYFKNLNFK